jgi:hypothetical protein
MSANSFYEHDAPFYTAPANITKSLTKVYENIIKLSPRKNQNQESSIPPTQLEYGSFQ